MLTFDVNEAGLPNPLRTGLFNTIAKPAEVAAATVEGWSAEQPGGAIFSGQVAAALAAGIVVLAKPAGQTPLVAAAAARALSAAGVARAPPQLLPDPGETVGTARVADVVSSALDRTGAARRCGCRACSATGPTA